MIVEILLQIIKIIVIFAVVMGCVAYLTLMERKCLGFFQIRLGPNRV
ncbi:MAG: NADH-quinone oxidoreductase subunit H, partial [Syntrophaceae bacterium]|nr:NADH-quinone oxidoreductase subunit H [Syntrophaceae bacterium]